MSTRLDGGSYIRERQQTETKHTFASYKHKHEEQQSGNKKTLSSPDDIRMLPNMLIDKSRFPAPARVALVVRAPLCVLANVVAVVLIVSGHHEEFCIGVGKLADLDTVTVDRGVG